MEGYSNRDDTVSESTRLVFYCRMPWISIHSFGIPSHSISNLRKYKIEKKKKKSTLFRLSTTLIYIITALALHHNALCLWESSHTVYLALSLRSQSNITH